MKLSTLTALGTITLASTGISGIAHASQDTLPAQFTIAQAVPVADDSEVSPQPIPLDPDAAIDKAKPADEMRGDTAPTGTDLDVDPDSATADGVPRDAESSFVNTVREDEAEVGIPDSQTGILNDSE